jgi:hypothetical protein
MIDQGVVEIEQDGTYHTRIMAYLIPRPMALTATKRFFSVSHPRRNLPHESGVVGFGAVTVEPSENPHRPVQRAIRAAAPRITDLSHFRCDRDPAAPASRLIITAR